LEESKKNPSVEMGKTSKLGPFLKPRKRVPPYPKEPYGPQNLRKEGAYPSFKNEFKGK